MQSKSRNLDLHTPLLTAVDPRRLTVRSVGYYRSVDSLAAEPQINYTNHDPAGRAIAQRDPRLFLDASAPANLSTIYSLSGAVLCEVSVDSGMRLSLFGEAGQPVHSWDGRGSQRWMHYDPQLRLIELFEQAVQGTAICAERLTYAANEPAFADHNQCGRLICHEDPPGALQFNDYALTGAVLEQERCFTDQPSPGFITRSRFNPLGDLLSRTDAKGNEQRFSQALDGQLLTVALRLNDTPDWLPMVSALRYNAHGQVQQEVAGNGVTTTLDYSEEDGRLKQLVSRLGQDDPLQDLRYAYDPVGNVSSIEDAVLPVRYFANQRVEPVNHYCYDTLYRLIEATGWEAGSVNHGPTSVMATASAMPGNYRQTYRYDNGNNLLELTHVGPQNHGHRLVAAAHSNRCLPVRNGIDPGEDDFRNDFDANGNVLRLQPGQTLDWDVRNQLREVRPIERDAGDDDYERYEYGADGMRVRKVRSLQTNAQTNIIETLYLTSLEIRTHSGTGEILHIIDVATGRGSVRVLHWEAGGPSEISNNQRRYSLTDHLGSSMLELDQHANIITQERYYPFGGTAWWNGTAVQVSYKTARYSGKERDASGFYNYGFRYCVPGLQRWLNSDPAGAVDGLNTYCMLLNNPLSGIDEDGRMFKGLATTAMGLGGLAYEFYKRRSVPENTPTSPTDETGTYGDKKVNNLLDRLKKISTDYSPGTQIKENVEGRMHAAGKLIHGEFPDVKKVSEGAALSYKYGSFIALGNSDELEKGKLAKAALTNAVSGLSGVAAVKATVSAGLTAATVTQEKLDELIEATNELKEVAVDTAVTGLSMNATVGGALDMAAAVAPHPAMKLGLKGISLAWKTTGLISTAEDLGAVAEQYKKLVPSELGKELSAQIEGANQSRSFGRFDRFFGRSGSN